MNDTPHQPIAPPDPGLRILEALIFAAAEPVSETALKQRLPADADLPALLAELERQYAARGVNLTRVDGRYCFRTAPDVAPALRLERPMARKMSRAAIETLAIVAYHQPITRAEIEEVRGVSLSRGTLDVLMEAGWVQPKGHREAPGRPATWVTTPAFLIHFGLDRLGDLPGVEELKAAGLLDARPTISSYAEEAALPPSVEESAIAEEALDRGEPSNEDVPAEPAQSAS